MTLDGLDRWFSNSGLADVLRMVESRVAPLVVLGNMKFVSMEFLNA